LRITGQDTVNTISKSQTEGVFDSPATANRNGRTEQNAGIASDQIDLGSQSELVSQAQTASSGDRAAARLEQLRALVQSGQYQVDSRALSQSIVSAAVNGF
jgi:anti-sigma28 factor (negative regulator of flagellin synthesis)